MLRKARLSISEERVRLNTRLVVEKDTAAVDTVESMGA